MADQTYLSEVQWGKLLAKAWTNPDFKEQLELDPSTAIKEFAQSELGTVLSRPFQVPPAPSDLIVEHLTGDRPQGSSSADFSCYSSCGTACIQSCYATLNAATGAKAQPQNIDTDGKD